MVFRAGKKIRIPENELNFSFARSSGPGGQHVNKTETRAVLHWHIRGNETVPGGIKKRFRASFGNRINSEGEFVLQCEEHRSRKQNIDECLNRFRQMLLSVASPPKRRKKTRPPRSAKRKRLEKKSQQAEKKKQRRKVNPKDHAI